MTTLLDGLVAYWKLDETSGTRNDSHRGNHLAQTNTPSYSAGKISNACNFVRASSQYLSIADNIDLSTGDVDFTFSCWVKIASKPGAGTFLPILSKDTSGSREHILMWAQSNDRFNWYIINSAGTANQVVANALGSPSTGVWYHVIVWHDSVANQIGIRVNDQYQDTFTTTIVPNNSTTAFMIGRWFYDASPNNGHWDGDIDEVGFWKRTLTASEKTELYRGGLGRAFPFGIGWHDMLIDAWRLDETSGDRLALINGNHLTAWNAPGYAAGIKNNAVVCDAAKALYHADCPMLSTGAIPFTFSVWVYMTSKPAQYQGILSKYHTGGSPNEFNLYYEYSNDKFLWEPGSYSIFATALGSPALNTWYHICCWYDPFIREAGIRVNDAYQNLDTGTFKNAPPDSADEFDVGTFDGRFNANIGFRGRIDELRFWKRILTPTEKTALASIASAPYTDYPFGSTNNRTRRGITRGVGRGT